MRTFQPLNVGIARTSEPLPPCSKVVLLCIALSRLPMAGARANAQSSPVENCQIRHSGSGRRKGTGIDKLLVGGSAVQFDKIDQHQLSSDCPPLFLAQANTTRSSGSAI